MEGEGAWERRFGGPILSLREVATDSLRWVKRPHMAVAGRSALALGAAQVLFLPPIAEGSWGPAGFALPLSQSSM